MMNKELYDKLVHEGRRFMRHDNYAEYGPWESDQELKKPQPPLVKARMSTEAIALPKDFKDLSLENDLTKLLIERKSHRVYTEEKMSLLAVSYLLWATQGVKSIRGNNYATLRTVPSGGARHPFETYLLVRDVEGLKSGLYHYLPLEHSLEYLQAVDDIKEAIDEATCRQTWAAKANVLFIYTCVAYRCEWRYGFAAHRPALIDLGHIGENLYLASTALGLGTCGIAAFDDDYINNLLKIDGDEEYACYVEPVGTIKAEDKGKEEAFYSFLKDDE